MIALAGVAGATVGRACVVANLPRWEADYPGLSFGLDVTGLRDRLENPAPGHAAKPGARQPGQADKSLLPTDIPLPEKPAKEMYNISADQVTAYQEVTAKPAAAADSLLTAMAAKGWKAGQRDDSGDSIRLTWTKPGRACQAEILAPRGPTELWLRCGNTGSQ
jgi:hypothetical protein